MKEKERARLWRGCEEVEEGDSEVRGEGRGEETGFEREEAEVRE